MGFTKNKLIEIYDSRHMLTTVIVEDSRSLTVKSRIGKDKYCTVLKDRYPFQKGDKIVSVSGQSVSWCTPDALFKVMCQQSKPYSVNISRKRGRSSAALTFSNPLYDPLLA